MTERYSATCQVVMEIPSHAVVSLYVVSFIVLAFEYFRVNPVRRVFNLYFGLMLGAVVLMLARVFLVAEGWLSLAFLALALVWLGLSLYLLRRLPPPRH
jgi:hypothetical protein